MEYRNGRYIEEREAEFEVSAGYKAIVTIKPLGMWTKLLSIMRMSRPEHVSIEIYDGLKETDFVILSSEKQRNRYSGVFQTRKGTKIVRVVMDSDAANSWQAEIYIERLFS